MWGGSPDDEGDSDVVTYFYKFNSDGTQNSAFGTYTKDGTSPTIQITVLDGSLFYAGIDEGETSGIIAGIDINSGSLVTDLFTDGYYPITGYQPTTVNQDAVDRLVAGAFKNDMGGMRIYRFR